MGIWELFVVTFFATSAMTLFSYIISEIFKKLYKEPVLLEFIIRGFHFKIVEKLRIVLSWFIHYLIGFIFVVFYYLPIWLDCAWYEITFFSGFIFGSIIGIIGISGWHFMFKLSPTNAAQNRKGYYLQLYVAHVIFGITAVFVHLLLK